MILMQIIKEEIERVEYKTIKFDSKAEKICITEELEEDGWELLDPSSDDLTVIYRKFSPVKM